MLVHESQIANKPCSCPIERADWPSNQPDNRPNFPEKHPSRMHSNDDPPDGNPDLDIAGGVKGGGDSREANLAKGLKRWPSSSHVTTKKEKRCSSLGGRLHLVTSAASHHYTSIN